VRINPNNITKISGFEQIGKDLNESEREKTVLNIGEKQKNGGERQYEKKYLLLHLEIQKFFVSLQRYV